MSYENEEETFDAPEGVAIIGMSGRFPGARDIETFWQNLRDGVESITHFGEDELRQLGVSEALLADPNYVRANGRLADVELFDAPFFGFTPREAEITDPQHRLFLECAWEALEAAGYDPTRYEGLIGVYGGAGLSSYLLYNLAPQRDELAVSNFQLLMGNNKDYVPTRVSYKLNLKGPSVNVNTACSTSLVAVHLACQALLDYQTDMVLAGGAGIQVPQDSGYLYEVGNVLSPDGRCRAFDAAAQGTANGNGVGVVVLKRLAEALADGDHIEAVILGSAINNDGADKVGFTAPSVNGQAQVIASAQAIAEVEPESISYIEAHGTGTQLGDPIEVRALTEVFREKTDKVDFCALGSVKTNIGHLDEAAGAAGLIKTVLALKHKQLPPSLNFERPNPALQLEQSPFFVNDKLCEWKSEGPRRAGVSSFGIGGTNAHLIVEEAPEIEAGDVDERPFYLLPISAQTETALQTAVQNLAEHFEQHSELNLADVAYTLSMGRKEMAWRQTAVVAREGDAAAKLLTLGEGSKTAESQPRLIFMFAGQGTQYAGMAQELYDCEPTFREAFDACDTIFEQYMGQSLRQVVFVPKSKEQINQTVYTQAAIFAVEYALAQMWMAWGVQPAAMIGHSIGEYVAACLAGVFTLENALWIVTARGRLMQSCPSGEMIGVALSEEEVRPYLNDDVSLAVVNTPGRCVLAGGEAAMEALREQLDSKGVVYRPLHTSHAFHSVMMEPILEQFVTYVRRAPRQAPQIPFISNVTGTWITAEQATDPEYWGQQIRQTVRFAEGLQTLQCDDSCVLLEIGPGRTLATLARPQVQSALIATSLPHPQERQHDYELVMQSLGRLWSAGVRVNWEAYFQGERRLRVLLPTYPFEKQRYWIEAPQQLVRTLKPQQDEIGEWLYRPVWEEKAATAVGEAGDWLVLGSEERATVAVKALQAAGQTARVGAVGERAGYLPKNILHVGLLEPDGEIFAELLEVARWLNEVEPNRPHTIVVASCRMQRVMEGDVVEPQKALALGALRTIPLEYEGMRCVNVDFAEGEIDVAALVAAAAGDEVVVAVRDGQRFGPSLRPLEPSLVDAQDLGQPRGVPVLDSGVWLVTGGVGSMGLALAGYLARAGRGVKLALVGRGRLSEEQRQEVRPLEQWGAEVLYVQANVADEKQMTAAIAQINEKFGKINGVIHAAGVADGALIARRTAAMDAQVLAPKVQGVLLLDKLLTEEPDIWVLCSALSGTTGSAGQAAYVGANAFLDAFAQRKRAEGHVAVSIAWDAWREVGMAVKAARRPESVLAEPLRPVGHPLFEGYQVKGERAVFVTRLQAAQWVLDEHRIDGVPVLPGTAYLAMAQAAWAAWRGEMAVMLRDVVFARPLAVEDTAEVETVLTSQATMSVAFEIRSRGADGSIVHAQGLLDKIGWRQPPKWLDIAAVQARCQREIIEVGQGGSVLEKALKRFGAHWQNIERVYVGEGEGLAVLALPEAAEDETADYALHPALLDMATGFLVLNNPEHQGLPFAYRKLQIWAPLRGRIWSYARQTGDNQFDVTIADEKGRVLVEIEGYVLRESEGEQKPENFALQIGSPGLLDTLSLQPDKRIQPAADEVEIEVKAVGLNFKEVLFALGMLELPEGTDAPKFGLECAGVVTAVGDEVDDVAVGDEVIALTEAALRGYAIAPAKVVVRKPAGLSWAEAATIPAAYLTAYQALVKVGRLQKGERVLIHAAAGGVGQAAVQIAQWLGAEIFATAGRPEKRAFLEAQGVAHVLNSRTLEFVEQIAALTKGEGVDVVLNSLSGEFLDKSLDCLGQYGRFLEIGVRDIMENRPLGLRPFARNLQFTAVGVGSELPRFKQLLAEVVAHIEAGDWATLPHKVFALGEVEQAFEFMAQAQHIGKVVIDVTDLQGVERLWNRQNHRRSRPGVLAEGLSTAEGVAIFARAVRGHEAQVIVSKRPLGEVLVAEEPMVKVRGGEHQRPMMSSQFVGPRNEVEQAVAAVWQEMLGIAQIGVEDNFFELGGDSLLAAQVISRIYRALGVELPLSAIFDEPTVAALGQRVRALQGVRQVVLEEAPVNEVDEDEEEGEI